MHKFKQSLFLALILICVSVNSRAAPWQFEIAPYLWAINMNGSESIANINVPVSETFSDLMKYFKGGAMIALTAKKDKFGLFANGMYSYLRKDTNVATGFGPETIRSTSKYGIFTAGAWYEVYKRKFNACSALALQPYIGARYTLNNAKLSILNTNLSAKKNEHWTDPILGTRLLFNREQVRFIFAGDIGGINHNQSSYNLMGLVGYNPCSAKWFTIYLGYEYLYQKFVTGSGTDYFAWKMHLFGPMLGFTIGF